MRTKPTLAAKSRRHRPPGQVRRCHDAGPGGQGRLIAQVIGPIGGKAEKGAARGCGRNAAGCHSGSLNGEDHNAGDIENVEQHRRKHAEAVEQNAGEMTAVENFLGLAQPDQ